MSKSKEQFSCPRCEINFSASAYLNHIRRCIPDKVSELEKLRKQYGCRAYSREDLSLIINPWLRIFTKSLSEEDIYSSPLPKELKNQTLLCKQVAKKHSQERQGFNNPVFRSKKTSGLTQEELTELKTLWNSGVHQSDLIDWFHTINRYPGLCLASTLGQTGKSINFYLANIFNLTEKEFKAEKARRQGLKISTGLTKTYSNPIRKKQILKKIKQSRKPTYITKNQIALFETLNTLQPNQWKIETSRDWYEEMTPDISHVDKHIAVEIDGRWIHGEIKDTDSEFIKRSKTKHHKVDAIKNTITEMSDVVIIRTWDEGEPFINLDIMAVNIIKIAFGEANEDNRLRIIRKSESL